MSIPPTKAELIAKFDALFANKGRTHVQLLRAEWEQLRKDADARIAELEAALSEAIEVLSYCNLEGVRTVEDIKCLDLVLRKIP